MPLLCLWERKCQTVGHFLTCSQFITQPSSCWLPALCPFFPHFHLALVWSLLFSTFINSRYLVLQWLSDFWRSNFPALLFISSVSSLIAQRTFASITILWLTDLFALFGDSAVPLLFILQDLLEKVPRSSCSRSKLILCFLAQLWTRRTSLSLFAPWFLSLAVICQLFCIPKRLNK